MPAGSRLGKASRLLLAIAGQSPLRPCSGSWSAGRASKIANRHEAKMRACPRFQDLRRRDRDRVSSRAARRAAGARFEGLAQKRGLCVPPKPEEIRHVEPNLGGLSPFRLLPTGVAEVPIRKTGQQPRAVRRLTRAGRPTTSPRFALKRAVLLPPKPLSQG